MIPVLFSKTATDFTSYGIGALSDTISCVVTEERNGKFELKMEYPTSGIHFSDIENSAIILAKPNESQNAQAFRIYAISSPMNEIVTIDAEHISYQLNFIPVAPITGTSCADAMSKIVGASLVTNPFTFSTDKNVSSVFTTGTPRSVRSLLGGSKGSLLEQYKGEYLWNNWTVSLLNARGSDNGVVLRYGKNITEFEQDEDLSNTVTGVLPYWNGEAALIVGDISKVTNTFPFERIETIDVTSDIEVEEGATPTKAQVTSAGLAALNNKSYVAVPATNIKISFVALWQTEEYKDIAPLESVGLCDTVTVIYEKYGVSKKEKVIKTVYDTLLERYNEIELGDVSSNLTTTIAATNEAVSDTMSSIEKLDDRISLKVSKGDVSSQLSVETDAIELNTAGRLLISAGNFTLDEDGNATAINFTAKNAFEIVSPPVPSGDPAILYMIAGFGIDSYAQVSFVTDKDNPSVNTGATIICKSLIMATYDNGGIADLGDTTITGSLRVISSDDYQYLELNNKGIANSVRLWNYSAHGLAITRGGIVPSSSVNPLDANVSATITIADIICNKVNANDVYGHLHETGSSKRWKHDITDTIDEELDPHKLYDINVVQFKFNEDFLKNGKDDRLYEKNLIGFIAEDVEEKYPIACQYDADGEIENWTHRYLIPPMLKLIQEQHEEIELLKTRIEILEGRINN